MVKQKLITFALLLLSLTYLAVSFSSPSIKISSNEQLVSLEENTKVSISGFPSSFYISKDYSSFKINNVEVRLSNVKEKINYSLEIIGYKSSYMNKTWIQATKITYDN